MYKKNCKVSLVIPVYNVEKFLKKCLDTVLLQNFKDFEVILIDDGSTDTSGTICDEYQKKDNRINVIHKDNGGVSEARNLGILNASGDYLIFIDSDDYIKDDYIKLLVDGIESGPFQLACADYYISFNNNIEIHSRNDGMKENYTSVDGVNELINKEKYQGYLWNKIFNRKIIVQNCIFFDTSIKIWEDLLFCLQYMKCIDTLIYIRTPIYFYVQHQNSAISNPNLWLENTHLIALDKMWEESKFAYGRFNEYISNYYCNELVGMLGKPICNDMEEVSEFMKKIANVNGKLTRKHKLKWMIFQIFPLIGLKIFGRGY